MIEFASLTAVIVGAGHAAGELATSLRDNGWQGRIILIGEESSLPYHRPPLSKAYLAGEVTAQSLLIKSEVAYQKANVEFINNMRVTKINRATRQLCLADGSLIHYDRLILATGGRPRPLPVPNAELAHKAANFKYLRTLKDVEGIQQQFTAGKQLVIIGGGYVGLEVAAVAVKAGLKVSVLEAMPRVLARVTAPELSAFYETQHRNAGVSIQTNTQVADIKVNTSGEVEAVLCQNGKELAADLVIVGIGLLPNVELASEAGLEVDNGIMVDEYGQTSDPLIYAAGDCTNHPNPLLGRRLRLESVPNALEQSRCVTASLCGKPKIYASIPWFWSDQYDLKLKMVGLSEGYDQLVIRGSLQQANFAAFYLKDGIVIASDTVNSAPDFMQAKRLINDRIPVNAEQLADKGFALKDLQKIA